MKYYRVLKQELNYPVTDNELSNTLSVQDNGPTPASLFRFV